MSLTPLKITFRLDGSGVYYDPLEPPHLDALMAWALMPFHVPQDQRMIERDDEPHEIPIPLGKWEQGNVWGWHASALFPDGEAAETLTHWRKRFRVSRIEMTEGSPNLSMGVYRDYNMPLPLLLCPAMTSYALGDRKRVQDVVRRIRYIGKKRAYGHGRVISVETEIIDDDRSTVYDGHTMRYMPGDGTRLVRPRPPYWSNVGRVQCLEIGEKYV